MSPKLRELIEQTEKDVSGKWVRIDNVEQLAAKIVRECAGIVENLPPGYIDYRNQIEDAFRRDCVGKIQEQFGIE